MKRIKQTLVFDHVIEIRSRPLWVVVLEFWFLWVHELWCHVIKIKIPTGDPYWGDDAIEAAFNHFYSWTPNVETIDASYPRVPEAVLDDQAMMAGLAESLHTWDEPAT